MALTACPDCQTPVSTEAPACPKCARPLRTQSQFLDLGANARSCLGAIGLIFVLIVGGVLLSIAGVKC